MKRNGMCPICFIKRLFIKANKTSIKPEFDNYSNGVALTPPMGWSSWNTFANRINEDLILSTAQAMKDKRLLDAGYKYINLDDCWQSSLRDSNGELIGDLETFPSGIENLVKKINSLGLKVGAYTSNGTYTCEDLPASLGKEDIDAYTLAKWGIEYFKYDFCHNIPISKYAPIIYSISISKNGKTKEYNVNNGRVTGLAKFMPCSKVESKKVVSGLDKNLGRLIFDNINAEEDGEYVLTINVIKKGQYEKYLIAKVNDDKEYEITFPPQKPQNITARFQVKVELKKGTNKIELFNPITCKADSEMYQYMRMGKALKDATMRVAKERDLEEKPIVYSICEWGFGKPYNWGAKAGNLWRTTPDIKPIWIWIKLIYEHNVKLYKFASLSHYNDPDMLEVGNGKLTYNQNISHFSLWCMMNAPLILGNDIRTMSDKVKEIVTNSDMISINQDSLCKQAKRVKKGSIDILCKPLENDRFAICFFNKTNSKKKIRYNINSLLNDDYINLKKKVCYSLYEVWSKESSNTDGGITLALEPSETKVFILK